jgi:integrase
MAMQAARVSGGYRGRRAKGEGTIGPWKGDRWRVRVTIQGKTRAWILPTKQTAVAKLHQLQQERAAGIAVLSMSTRTKLGPWLDEWLVSVRISHPRTAPTYARWLGKHVTPALGHLTLGELTPPLLLHFFADTLSDRLGPESRRHVYQVLHAALNAAVRRRLMPANPLSEVPKPRGSELERPTLTVDECRRLLDMCADDRLGAIIVVALYSGAREGELLALTWRDIDFETGHLTINKSLAAVQGLGLVTSPTKTRAGRRVITLPQPAIDALRRHYVRQGDERLAAAAWPADLVFTTTRGTPIERQNLLRRYWYPLLSRAELPPIHFHDLRHTAALLMMRSGHLTAVSRRLGHSTTAITAELYGHSTPVDDERMTAGVAAMLAEPTANATPGKVLTLPVAPTPTWGWPRAEKGTLGRQRRS